MSSYIFASDQISSFKAIAYALRDALKPFSDQHEWLDLPTKTAMFDIAASVLGYADYQIFLRISKGHVRRPDPPLVLTQKRFDDLSGRFVEILGRGFSKAHCRWAIAGLFALSPDRALSQEDVALLKNAVIVRRMPYPTTLTNQEERLVSLECLERVMEHPNMDPQYEAILIGVRSTSLGCWVAARAEAQIKGKLSHLALAYFGLPSELCLMRILESSVSIRWGTAEPINQSLREPGTHHGFPLNPLPRQ